MALNHIPLYVPHSLWSPFFSTIFTFFSLIQSSPSPFPSISPLVPRVFSPPSLLSPSLPSLPWLSRRDRVLIASRGRKSATSTPDLQSAGQDTARLLPRSNGRRRDVRAATQIRYLIVHRYGAFMVHRYGTFLVHKYSTL